MKGEIFGGVALLGLALLCLGHVGQLVELLPQAWFLMFVGASAAISYAVLGYLLIRHAVKSHQEWLAQQNRRRSSGNSLTALLRGMRFGK